MRDYELKLMSTRRHSPPVARLALANGSTYDLLALWTAHDSRQGVYMDTTPHYMPPFHYLCHIIDIDFCLRTYGGTLTIHEVVNTAAPT